MSMEHTVAILFGPAGTQLRSQVEQRIVSAGFIIVSSVDCVNKELEKAGINASLEDTTLANETVSTLESEEVHVAFLLERKSAVAEWKDLAEQDSAALNENSLRATYPSLRLHGSPSASTAATSILTLFPAYANLITSQSLGLDASASPARTAGPPGNIPFVLSNDAHLLPQSPNSTNKLSPTVERALNRLDMEEHRRKLGEGWDGEGGDPSTPRSEARVFTYRSRENTGEVGKKSEASESEHNFESEEVDSVLEESEAEEDAEGAEDFSSVVEHNPVSGGAPTIKETTKSIRRSSTIEPRLTKAAALRLDISLPPREPPVTKSHFTPTSITEIGTGASSAASASGSSSSGRRVSVVPQPKSLAAPTIAPRATKASQLRQAGEEGVIPSATKMARRESLGTSQRSYISTFENTPGHKREERIQVASTAPPKIQPRLTRSEMLKAGMEIPISAAMRRQSSTGSSSAVSDREAINATPSQSAPPKIVVKSTAPPSIAPRATKASQLRAGLEASESSAPPMNRMRSLSALEDLAEETGEIVAAPAMVRANTVGATVGPDPTHRVTRRMSLQPTNAVRMTKAAALRLGLEVELPSMRGSNKDGANATFEGVAGHKRRESIQVASTAEPKIQPRMSRASMLRNGLEVPDSPAERRASAAPVDFEGIPGHKRRETIQIASSRPPTIVPRLNKSVLLRTAADARSASSSLPLSIPAIGTTSRGSLTVPNAPPRSTSSLSASSSSAAAVRSTTSSAESKAGRPATLQLRSNKSAELRQAMKKEEVEVAAAAALKAKAAAAAGVPSSRKVVRRPAPAQGVLGASSVANGG